MKKIVVDEAYCKGCHLCISQCRKAVLAVSDIRNAKGYLVPQADEPENCTGCLQCEMICPDMAIVVEDAADEK
ncbi:MAG: 4Fe-4S binding protein [Deltaproteobacteria bacterium]|nr:4Fe-4S binding protein [Deltaproteobacteria bacterium]